MAGVILALWVALGKERAEHMQDLKDSFRAAEKGRS